MSAADQLLRLTNHLQMQKKQGRDSVILFTDIRKAYDRVYRKAVIVKMYRRGLGGKVLRIIDRLLQNTVCRVVLKSHISKEYRPEEGVAQGGILSCLIWNILFASLPVRNDENVFYAAFADDLAIVVSHDDKRIAYREMTSIYGEIRTWTRHNRIEFNDDKVKCMYVAGDGRTKAKRKKRHRAVQAFVPKVLYWSIKDGMIREVEQVTQYKYLGAIIDSRLSFEAWVRKIAAEVRRRVKFVKRVAGTMKIGRELIEKLYEAYVRGYVNYGILIWGSRKNRVKVEAADRDGLRLCAGVLPGTSNDELDARINTGLPSRKTQKNQNTICQADVRKKASRDAGYDEPCICWPSW